MSNDQVYITLILKIILIWTILFSCNYYDLVHFNMTHEVLSLQVSNYWAVVSINKNRGYNIEVTLLNECSGHK